MDQKDLLQNLKKNNEKSRPKIKEGLDKNEILLIMEMLFIKVENWLLILSEV